MKNSVNFYEELKIDSSCSLEEIQKKLVQLERDWTQRQINNPEKATKMLAMVIDARKAFQNEATRHEYDRALENSRNEAEDSSPEQLRQKQFKKWFDDAREYFQNQEYDLAKVAIDRAVQYTTPETSDTSFYSYLVDIYSHTENHRQAIEYSNETIVLNPYSEFGYMYKITALFNYYLSDRIQEDKKRQIAMQLASVLRTCIEKAKKNDNAYTTSEAYSRLAMLYYDNMLCQEEDNVAEAEKYAKESLALGFEFPGAVKVMERINSRRGKIDNIKNENALLEKKQKDEVDRIKEQNEKLMHEIADLRKSIGNKTRAGNTSFLPYDGFVRNLVIGGMGAIALGLLAMIMGAHDGGIVLFIGVAVVGLRVIYINRNKNIESVLRDIHKKEEIITENKNFMRSKEIKLKETIRERSKEIEQLGQGMGETKVDVDERWREAFNRCLDDEQKADSSSILHGEKCLSLDPPPVFEFLTLYVVLGALLRTNADAGRLQTYYDRLYYLSNDEEILSKVEKEIPSFNIRQNLKARLFQAMGRIMGYGV